MAEMYRISGERLKGFADQARRLGKISGELTPGQIEDTLKGVTAGGGSSFQSMVTDAIANHFVSAAEFAPGGILEEYIPTYYSYNGIVLPEIPPTGYENCPYLMILRYIGDDSGTDNIWLYGSTSKPYYLLQDSVDRLEFPSGRTRSKFDAESGVWGGANVGTSGTWCNLTESWEVLWANHDIPNGSATATDIYFEGSEPVPAE